jgi:hypothetical protein
VCEAAAVAAAAIATAEEVRLQLLLLLPEQPLVAAVDVVVVEPGPKLKPAFHGEHPGITSSL